MGRRRILQSTSMLCKQRPTNEKQFCFLSLCSRVRTCDPIDGDASDAEGADAAVDDGAVARAVRLDLADAAAAALPVVAVREVDLPRLGVHRQLHRVADCVEK